ncbi:MAG TPA: hypothetical protein PLP58_23580 [Prosthecobacter sp.]|nr:hypothetical protein [Prosthecobacter sp.]
MDTRTFDPAFGRVTDCMNREALEALVNLRAGAEQEARMAVLGEKANEGTLTREERKEYEEKILFGSFFGILQAKARKKLKALAE